MAGRIIDCAGIEQDDGMFDCAKIAQDKRAYAMRVCGDAGFPVARNGQYIVVEPHLKAAPTDHVVIAFKDGRTMLQELITAGRNSITVMSLDRSTTHAIERSEILPSFGVQVVTAVVSSRVFRPN